MLKRLIILLVGVATVSIAALATPSLAAFPHTTYASADPVDWTPNVEDGRVRNLATVDGVTVAVGNFTRVSEVGGPTFDRRLIVAFDGSGKVSTTFNPVFTGSQLYDVIPAGDGRSVFVAGQFSKVDGFGGTNRLVKLDVHTGAVDRSFRPPAFNNRTTMLEIANGRLYVSGAFTQVGGQPTTLLTALDPSTGAQTGHVNIPFSQTWNGGTLEIVEFTMRPDGSRLVAIGNFRYAAGQYRPQIVMINTSGATATVDSWATTRYGTTCSRSFETYMYDVDSAPDGSYFVVGTTGAYSGGPSSGTLCDAAARWEWGRSGGSQQPTWINYTGGDTITAVEVTGPAIYLGGHFRWSNNPYCSDKACPGSVGRKGLAALDPRNGLPLSWNPQRLRGWGVWGFRSSAQGLWIGHDTDSVGGETHKRIALMPLTSVAPAEERTGNLPGDVYLLNTAGADDEVTRQGFTGTSAGPRTVVANGGQDWSSSRGAFMVDGIVYTGWSDGRLTYRSYDGTRFGLTRNVNLYKSVEVPNDLRNMKTMFLDRVTGRLYYSLAGSSRLYFRYFTTESQVVGAQRFEVPAGGIDFSQVSGGFLVGGNLYYRTDSGELRRVAWSNGPTGGVTAVSGPSIDGTNWSSRSMFLFAP